MRLYNTSHSGCVCNLITYVAYANLNCVQCPFVHKWINSLA